MSTPTRVLLIHERPLHTARACLSRLFQRSAFCCRLSNWPLCTGNTPCKAACKGTRHTSHSQYSHKSPSGLALLSTGHSAAGSRTGPYARAARRVKLPAKAHVTPQPYTVITLNRTPSGLAEHRAFCCSLLDWPLCIGKTSCTAANAVHLILTQSIFALTQSIVTVTQSIVTVTQAQLHTQVCTVMLAWSYLTRTQSHLYCHTSSAQSHLHSVTLFTQSHLHSPTSTLHSHVLHLHSQSYTVTFSQSHHMHYH